MKAWTVYWLKSRPRCDKKNHGSTTVVASDIIKATELFVTTHLDREISSISSESDEVLFDD